MNSTTTLYALPLAVAVALAATLALYAWRRRSTPGAPFFAIVMLALTEWTLGYALELTSNDLSAAIFWAKMQYLGLASMPVGWLLFALHWAGYTRWLTRRNLLLLLIIPLLTLTLVVTNETHGLIWRRVTLTAIGPFIALRPSYGPWFVIHILFSHLLLAIGSGILVQRMRGMPLLYRGQLITLLASIGLPWLSNLLYVLDISPIAQLDLAPFSFTLAGFGIVWSVVRSHLLDLMPVARDVLIESMRDGVFVLDTQQRIVDLNPAASALLARPAHELIGRAITATLPIEAELLDTAAANDQPPPLLNLDRADQRIVCELTVAPLHDRRGLLAGAILALHDVTARLRAEEAMRASEARYRAVSELMSDYTYALSVAPDGTLSVEWVTDAYTGMIGYSIEEVRAMGGWISLVHPSDVPVAREFAATVFSGQSAVRDFRFRTKDGGVRCLQHYGKPQWDEQQQRIVRILGAGRDITMWTSAMRALRESEQRYRLLFERNPQPMWVYDQETLVFLAVNRAAIERYGYSEAEFLTMTLADLGSGEASQPLSAAHEQEPTLWRHRTRDGALIDVEITTHAIVFGGRPASVALAHDVTARRRAEQTLRQQNEYLAALHETMLTIMDRLDVDELLEAIVVRAATLIGADHGYIYLVERNPDSGQDELVVRVGVGIFRATIGSRQGYGVGLSGNVWRTGQPLVINNREAWPERYPTFDYYAGVGVPLTSGGQVVGVIGLAYLEAGRAFGADEIAILSRFAQLASIALDNARLFTTAQQEIAERKRAQADLACARDQALEAVRLKSEFLAVMSHEVRTPLNAIIGFTDFTLSQQIGPLNEQQLNNLQRVSRNAHHLLAQINGILDMSKLDADGMPLASEPMHIEDVISRAIGAIESLVISKQLRLDVQRPPQAPPVMLGDAGRLQQMLLNLLSNAVKFTPPHGAITVALEYGAADALPIAAPPLQGRPAGTWLALSVQDTGIGIPAEEHERIWSEFYQIDGSATRQYGGTGLGLAIVKRMTARMGGQVGLRSAVESGSTFTIWLPLAIAAETEREQALAINGPR
jgi:PAS domain S-box-containing protein